MIRAQARTTRDSISFIEKTYRKKEPQYADFSIRQQQRLLEKLSEEGSVSGCREPLPAPEKKAPPPPRLRDLVEVRWGLKRCEKIRSEIRATRDSISFIEKTYRKKEPQYADFSIRQQQRLLEKLGEEGSVSGCREPLLPPEKKALK
jgi:hypothetical protein